VEAKKMKMSEKSEFLRQSLESNCFGLREINVVSPLDSSIRFKGSVAKNGRFFSSAALPMQVAFHCETVEGGGSTISGTKSVSNDIDGRQIVASSSSLSASGLEAGAKLEGGGQTTAAHLRSLSLASKQQPALAKIDSFFERPMSQFVFKTGTEDKPEDMRQDQLVVQFFEVCDRLFKKSGNLDLALTPYKVVCLSRNDGMMEFLDGARNISDIQTEYKKSRYSLQQWFRDLPKNQDDSRKDGIAAEVVDTFVRSSAGYCVMTYVLNVGDRHLENLMVKQDGHLLHIDFGFIFGANPFDKKVLSTPLRLIDEMMAVMGDPGSKDYNSFERHCCSAFKILRKNCNLICTMLELMADAGIKDLSVNQDPMTVIAGVKERLCMSKTDEDAAQSWLLDKLAQSANNWKGRLMDGVHSMAVSIKFGGTD
jgi:phosphatidylinositol 3-kinase